MIFYGIEGQKFQLLSCVLPSFVLSLKQVYKSNIVQLEYLHGIIDNDQQVSSFNSSGS